MDVVREELAHELNQGILLSELDKVLSEGPSLGKCSPVRLFPRTRPCFRIPREVLHSLNVFQLDHSLMQLLNLKVVVHILGPSFQSRNKAILVNNPLVFLLHFLDDECSI